MTVLDPENPAHVAAAARLETELISTPVWFRGEASS